MTIFFLAIRQCVSTALVSILFLILFLWLVVRHTLLMCRFLEADFACFGFPFPEDCAGMDLA